jgi:uncharacterized RDD family membrane protein YckC
MKCPKCGYLGYERVERCRNCGYEFSLSSSPTPPPDLQIREGGGLPQPLDDLTLIDAALPPPRADRFSDVAAERPPSTGIPNGLAELPLFGPPITDDVPLITKVSPPRPPLSVRRATPEVPRLRAEPRAPLLDWPEPLSASPGPSGTEDRPLTVSQALGMLDGDEDPAAAERELRRRVAGRGAADPAGLTARAFAALFDVALLAAVDLVVVYFTMKICRLSPSEWPLLPRMPLLTFLLLQNGGYLVAFTTAGQTLGKMIAGVRVLSSDDDHAPDVGRSILRAIVWMVLALPAGLGLLTILMSRDRRGLHDRFAGTRVVRAGA